MSGSRYRCSRCLRVGLAAIGDDRPGQDIRPLGESFDICDCGGRLIVIDEPEYRRLIAAGAP